MINLTTLCNNENDTNIFYVSKLHFFNYKSFLGKVKLDIKKMSIFKY